VRAADPAGRTGPAARPSTSRPSLPDPAADDLAGVVAWAVAHLDEPRPGGQLQRASAAVTAGVVEAAGVGLGAGAALAVVGSPTFTVLTPV
jgi:hypothetical protein